MTDFKTGEEVTWGSGDIRAEVLGETDEEGRVLLALTRDYASPCGKVWPSGEKVSVPLEELRRLH